MKKLSKVWYSIVGVQYRLSYRLDGRSTNVYAAKSKNLRNMASHLAAGAKWELFKKGPFGADWRMIDYGVTVKNVQSKI